jgi:hypothetical protein
MPNTTRELTPREVEAGYRGINDEDLSATQIQALVRTMDGSKEKWSHLKSNKIAYEEKLQDENYDTVDIKVNQHIDQHI